MPLFLLTEKLVHMEGEHTSKRLVDIESEDALYEMLSDENDESWFNSGMWDERRTDAEKYDTSKENVIANKGDLAYEMYCKDEVKYGATLYGWQDIDELDIVEGNTKGKLSILGIVEIVL